MIDTRRLKNVKNVKNNFKFFAVKKNEYIHLRIEMIK